jgi:hypothetical protein
MNRQSANLIEAAEFYKNKLKLTDIVCTLYPIPIKQRLRHFNSLYNHCNTLTSSEYHKLVQMYTHILASLTEEELQSYLKSYSDL